MITGSAVMLAFFLALIVGILMVVVGLGVNMWAPLFLGLVAGILAGDVNLGLIIGSYCALMGLGFYTYGGATMPDFAVGAVFGVFAVAKTSIATGLSTEAAVDQVLPVVTALALLMSLFDILGRASTTVFQHGGDNALAKRNVASFQRWFFAGTIPWMLSRAVPIFIGMLFINQYQDLANAIQSVGWLSQGLSVVGRALPAVGFALLLSYMDIASYWPYMLAGFVLFAYMGLPTVGLAIVGAAAAGLYMKSRKELAKGGN
jgi:PTS system mannose-specific IIC component